MNLIHTIDPDGMENLDDMNDTDLKAFAIRHQGGRNVDKLFDSSGRGAKDTTKSLANYAWNIITARRCRAEGKITEALNYERIAQDIYEGLPLYARW